ncbi:MAG TPA: hypothetical protein VNC16_01975 [Solirubrobacterales bacterium]|jgi:hypothetical protein|nr:hypothetical protein [Solirubrobacterales bacterium]
MVLGIIGLAIVALVAIGEWYLYDRSLWWHDDKRDPRNFPP